MTAVTTARRGAVALDGVTKRYGSTRGGVLALDRICLDVRPGEFVCLVGASGCGKSTLLSLAAGLDSPTGGSVRVDGRAALMFQEAALFPWLTVARNVELALRPQRVGRAGRAARVAALLDVAQLGSFADRTPHEPS